MVITDQAQFEQLVQEVRDQILSESQGVGEVDIVDNLDNIYSLPALKLNDSGDQVVEAPLSLLSAPAEEAAALARAAAYDANTAAESANSAASSANLATDKTNEAISNAQSATQRAESSADKANTAAQNADEATAQVLSGESERVEAENARQAAEAERQSAEEERKSAEEARKLAEQSREQAESSRVSAEESRVTAESERVTAESSRAQTETERVQKESERESAESTRQQNETARQSNEDTRVQQEQTRQTNEEQRVSAESSRETEYTDLKQRADALIDDNEAAIENANTAAENANAAIANMENTYAKKDEIPDVSEFITISVDNLVNYYRKSETYNQEQINSLIGSITTINFKIVDSLPETGQNNLIYLVPSSKQEENNIKDEYIWIDDSWELIGSTKIDLSNYYTKDEANSTFLHTGNYETTTDTRYVKKSGDTITGSLTINSANGLFFINGGDTGARISRTSDNELWLQANSNAAINLSAHSATKIRAINLLTDNATVNGSKIWHAGNDGSGSGLDADLLDGIHGYQFFQQGNSMPTSSDWGDYMYNRAFSVMGTIPTGGPSNIYEYGALLVFDTGGSTTNGGAITQIYFPHSKYNAPQYRTTFGRNKTKYHDWCILARTTDNVASATKLQTPRTIWGQSFDGTGNVSGDMTNVGYIKFLNEGAIGYYSNGFIGFTNKAGTVALPIKANSLVLANDFTPTSSYRLHVEGDIYTSSNIRCNSLVLPNGNSFGSGALELTASTPYIDFHYNNSTADYTSRLIEKSSGMLTCEKSFNVNGELHAGTLHTIDIIALGDLTVYGNIVGNISSDKDGVEKIDISAKTKLTNYGNKKIVYVKLGYTDIEIYPSTVMKVGETIYMHIIGSGSCSFKNSDSVQMAVSGVGFGKGASDYTTSVSIYNYGEPVVIIMSKLTDTLFSAGVIYRKPS